MPRHIRIPSHTRAAVTAAIQDALHELKHTNIRRHGPNYIRITNQIRLLQEALESVEGSAEYPDYEDGMCVTCCRPLEE